MAVLDIVQKSSVKDFNKHKFTLNKSFVIIILSAISFLVFVANKSINQQIAINKAKKYHDNKFNIYDANELPINYSNIMYIGNEFYGYNFEVSEKVYLSLDEIDNNSGHSIKIK